MIKRRNRLHALYKKTNKAEIYRKWVALRTAIKREVFNSHKNYINGMINEITFDSKPFWRYINGQRKDKHSIPPLQASGNIAVSDKDKAEALNGQFSSVFTRDSFDSIPFQRPNCSRMADISVSTFGVEKLLKNLKTSKAMGPDNIHPWVLRELATDLAPMISHLFQHSITTGEVPKDWKKANVCPIFKKNDSSLPSNYRPVSLTCICCKLLEHIISSNLMKHYDMHNILSSKQHAFRKNHSCDTQLVSVLDDWASALDKNKQVDVFILDFEKAFDTVPHELLKAKLFSLGVSRQVITWVDSFLSNRSQSVVVNGTSSASAPVLSGVPQGSVLGPVLFLSYINDIVGVASSEVRLFADDCVCYRVIDDPSDCDVLQRDIYNLGQWAKTWGMRFHPAKCNVMSITRKYNPTLFKYTLNGANLTRVDSIKYLGVTITKDLNWSKHIQSVCNKGNKILGLLRRNLSFCSKEVKLAAYKGLLRPLLDYACPVWDPHQMSLCERLEGVQRRSARFIASEYSWEAGTMTKLLKDLGLSTLSDRRRRCRLSMFAKGIYGQANIPLSELRKPTRSTRNMHALHYRPPSARTNCYKFSFIPNTIRDWNNLPNSIIDAAINHPKPEVFIIALRA